MRSAIRSVRRHLAGAPGRRDLALAALLGLVSLQSAFDADGLRQPALAVVALLELSALPVALRRLWPLGVLVVTLAAAVAGEVLLDGFQALGPLAALYTVARHSETRTAIEAAAGTAVALVWPAARTAEDSPLFAAGIYLVFGAAWLLGHNLRSRHMYLEKVAARAEQLEREQHEREQRAVAEEQARIARELHDVISHSVSVMVVQASAARDVFDAEPELARDALDAIEGAGRDALAELRRLLGVIHPAGAPAAAEREPQPGLARLPDLVAQASRAGARVELEVVGQPRAVPPGVDVSAYRVVQEALTNVHKHAHASTVRVVVRFEGARLDIEVLDDGPAGDQLLPGSGRGLIGMRERVSVLGGELAAGPRPDGGFGVHASIPLGAAAT